MLMSERNAWICLTMVIAHQGPCLICKLIDNKFRNVNPEATSYSGKRLSLTRQTDERKLVCFPELSHILRQLPCSRLRKTKTKTKVVQARISGSDFMKSRKVTIP
jgi:hypothetical protein